jgi:hypothetical protein
MTEADRREFLKKLAKSAVYAAPVIQTFAVPAELIGQGKSSQHKGNHGHGHAAPAPAPGAPAPWNQPPPGAMNP